MFDNLELTSKNCKFVKLNRVESTVAFMDKFYYSEFEYILFLDCFCLFVAGRTTYFISVIVRNYDYGKHTIVVKQNPPESISITQLKKMYGKLFPVNFSKNESDKFTPEEKLTYTFANEIVNKNAIPKNGLRQLILLDVPIILKAQINKNRTGYGSIYLRGDLVHQGTLYGEFTPFHIIGFNY